jgi:hypothetical protein
VNQSKKQHQLAIKLLDKLGLDHIQLVRQRNGYYRYHGWLTPVVTNNGGAKVRRDTVRLKRAR